MSNRVPSLCFHSPSGRYFVRFRQKPVYLGYDRKAAQLEYDRLIGEWLVNGRAASAVNGGPQDLNVDEVLARYRKHAETYYRLPSGKPSSELGWIAAAVRPLRRLYGKSLARDFGPLALEVVRDEYVKSGAVRSAVNGRVDRVRRIFRWAVSRELIPAGVYEALRTVSGLRRGRCNAIESRPVRPVDDAVIEATLRHVPEIVAAMVRIQRLTGMRPGEICIMRPCDIERSTEVWAFRPQRHKTEHHGLARTVLIGPKAQDILRPYLLRDPDAFCFVPSESEVRRRRHLHERRTTPPNYGNNIGTNRKQQPNWKAGDQYTVSSYRRAIVRGCEIVFKIPKGLRRIPKQMDAAERKRLFDMAREWRAANTWHPNQLRHACATELRRRFGIESARLILGHSDVGMTEIYAEADLRAASTIAVQVG